ncbi:hypothetical protein LINPERPRIM_LOCUS30429, partial [Linum perenne]
MAALAQSVTRLMEQFGVPHEEECYRPRKAWTSRGRPSRTTQGIYKPTHPLSGIICNECQVRDHTVRACP